MNVNSRPKRKILNETFKRFQRLPDWPPCGREQKERKVDQTRPAKVQFVLRPIPVTPESSGPQTLAE
jgi:hypothetical protein